MKTEKIFNRLKQKFLKKEISFKKNGNCKKIFFTKSRMVSFFSQKEFTFVIGLFDGFCLDDGSMKTAFFCAWEDQDEAIRSVLIGCADQGKILFLPECTTWGDNGEVFLVYQTDGSLKTRRVVFDQEVKRKPIKFHRLHSKLEVGYHLLETGEFPLTVENKVYPESAL